MAHNADQPAVTGEDSHLCLTPREAAEAQAERPAEPQQNVAFLILEAEVAGTGRATQVKAAGAVV